MKNVKVLVSLLTGALAIGGLTVSNASAAKSHAKHAGVHGKIVSVSGQTLKVQLKGKVMVTVTVTPAITVEFKDKAGVFKAGDRLLLEPDATNPTQIVDQGSGHARGHKKV